MPGGSHFQSPQNIPGRRAHLKIGMARILVAFRAPAMLPFWQLPFLLITKGDGCYGNGPWPGQVS